MEADGVDYSGLYDLPPWEDTPCHSNGLTTVTVSQVLCTLRRKEKEREVHAWVTLGITVVVVRVCVCVCVTIYQDTFISVKGVLISEGHSPVYLFIDDIYIMIVDLRIVSEDSLQCSHEQRRTEELQIRLRERHTH